MGTLNTGTGNYERKNNQTGIILYKTEDGRIKVDTIFQNETIWMTQAQMSELFSVERTVITKHLKNIFTGNELDENSVCAKFAHTAADGKKYQTKYYKKTVSRLYSSAACTIICAIF